MIPSPAGAARAWQRTIERAGRLEAQLAAMASAGPLKRLYVMLEDFDPQDRATHARQLRARRALDIRGARGGSRRGDRGLCGDPSLRLALPPPIAPSDADCALNSKWVLCLPICPQGDRGAGTDDPSSPHPATINAATAAAFDHRCFRQPSDPKLQPPDEARPRGEGRRSSRGRRPLWASRKPAPISPRASLTVRLGQSGGRLSRRRHRHARIRIALRNVVVRVIAWPALPDRASFAARNQGQYPSISVSSGELRDVRIMAIPPRRPTLCTVSGAVGNPKDFATAVTLSRMPSCDGHQFDPWIAHQEVRVSDGSFPCSDWLTLAPRCLTKLR